MPHGEAVRSLQTRISAHAGVTYENPQFASQPSYSPFSEEYCPAAQFINEPRRVQTPEHRLLLATVDQTKRDLKTRRHYADARAWFLSKSKAHPFTFSSICDALNVNPKTLRRLARRTRHPQTGRFACAHDSPTIAA